ncbi:hypothetical protein SAMD00023353_0203250 [Rosellinia necatrix]|uniref:Cytochrome p450 protein n=1 Tax=Rosellinia necatrix TaxID=77044 RepID=A0A1S7UJ93_ROSNE|nr:hypothetical protein SAMD00023353_0203250 [Rosellinia necatrix]
MVNLPQSGSMGETYPVYTGFWTDWSRGKVLGSTLTLTRNDANLLIAFVAFFLTVVTAQLWSIACFACHAFFSTKNPRDMLHHQRQAILRNNGAPAGTAITLIQLAWAWRHTPGVARRVTPLLACTVLLAIGFAAAAGFSSRVALGNTVLLRPRNCGIASNTLLDVETTSNIFLPWLAKQHTIASNYAQQCYSSSETLADCLNTAFVRRELGTSVDSNAPCPFNETVCSSTSSNIRLDSGFIDTHFDLGVNAPPDERFQFKTVLHCAPLTTKGYRSSYTGWDNQTFSRYFYGETPSGNFTYEYPTPDQVIYAILKGNATNGNRPNAGSLREDYTLNVVNARPFNGSYLSPNAYITFIPIPQLTRYDADLYVAFLSPNQIGFPQPTADPWYNSSRSGSLWGDSQVFNGTKLTKSAVRLYFSTEAASPLGCTYQYSYCFPELPEGRNCTPLAGGVNSISEIRQLGLKDATRNRLYWIHNAFASVDPTPSRILNVLGTRALTSRFKLSNGYQGFLPSNQWQLDVENWNSVLLTLHQQLMVSTVLGQLPEFNAFDTENSIHTATTEEAKTICSNQKINSAYHVSFSVLGITVIAILGLFVIFLSLTVESIVYFIQRRLKWSVYRRLEWISTGTLQIQRHLYEAHGVHPWRGCDELIPILEEEGAVLPMLDISNETHPFVKRRSQLAEVQKEACTGRSSETEVPDDSNAPYDQNHTNQQTTNTEQHHRDLLVYGISPTSSDTTSINER